jgi:hypothetical protein
MAYDEEFLKKHITEPTQKKTEAEIEYLKMKEAERKERLDREHRLYQEEQSGEEDIPYPPRSPKKKPVTKEEKRLAKLEAEKEKQKKELIKLLRETPIVQYASKKSGIGRSTYYKWRAEDFVFARVADRAIESGRFLMNDLAESKLLNQIQRDELSAITFWLRHNHPKYTSVNRVIHEYELVTRKPSIEEEYLSAEEMGKLLAESITPKIAVKDLRRMKERELKKAEYDEEDNKRTRSFERD